MSPTRHTTSRLVSLISIIVLQFAFFSCADRIKTSLIVYKELDSNLTASNTLLEHETQIVLASMEDKRIDPRTAEKATTWQEKALAIRKVAVELYHYVDSLKSELKKEANLKIDNGAESFREGEKAPVMRLFEKKEKGSELLDRLTKFEAEIVKVDPSIAEKFKRVSLSANFNISPQKNLDFTRTYFDDIPTVAALAVLSKFQNSSKMIENLLVTFCHNQIESGVWRGHDSFYATFVTINNGCAQPGEELEVMAGVGNLVKNPANKFKIDGTEVQQKADGAAYYKFKAQAKPGKYRLPVVVSFIDQNGKQQVMTKYVEYTVASH